MKGRGLLWVIVANLVVLVALTFVYPELMVSPGPLISAHAGIEGDCSACHAPWHGAASDRCIACHALADIGLRTTEGIPLPDPKAKASFHQQLIDQDCTACHSDHAGPKLTERSRKPFSHSLLQPATRDRCETCHTAPENDLHRKRNANCGACHSSQRWKPATFDHEAYFALDRNHDVSCATCHTGADYGRYTCYGCHEHTPARIRAEHVEEGIRNFENCVECHRNATDEPGESGSGREGERD